MSMSNKERQAAFRARQKAKDFEDAQERAFKAAKHAQTVAEIKAMTESQADPSLSEDCFPARSPDDDLVMVPRRLLETLELLDELFQHAYLERLYDGSDMTLLAFPTSKILELWPTTGVTDQES
jgi:hypothetical protein